jgi:hypothetical protein
MLSLQGDIEAAAVLWCSIAMAAQAKVARSADLVVTHSAGAPPTPWW